MKDAINDYVNKMLKDAKGNTDKFWDSIVPTSGMCPNLTGIEEWLYQTHKGDMTGVEDDWLLRCQWAPCMRLCGECVGTDKVGHFFEEGSIYQQIERDKGDKKYALGWGEWVEGRKPTDPDVLKWLREASLTIRWSGGTMKDYRLSKMFGVFGDRHAENPVGLADLEANAAGLSFWNTFFPSDGNEVTKKFNICDYVTDKWDERKNPNVPGDKTPFE